MNTPPIQVDSNATNVVVKVPSQILKINKHTLVGFGVGIVVTGGAVLGAKFVQKKRAERKEDK